MLYAHISALCVLVFRLTLVLGHQHEEECVHGSKTSTGSCRCEPLWSGHRCEHIACMHGGTPEPHRDPTYCKCTDHYIGKHCEISTLLCQSRTCLNGGHCYHDDTRHYCACPTGYNGTSCEYRVSVSSSSGACGNHPCRHGGHCFEDSKGYYCECSYPYSGNNCENVDICSRTHCRNGGRCLHELSSYYCHCPPNFTGRNCEIPVTTTVATTTKPFDICSYSPCVRGICGKELTGYRCFCPIDYTGQHCETSLKNTTVAPIINGCSNHPCKHNGHCFSDDMEYICVCRDGYIGLNCEHVTTTAAPTTIDGNLQSVTLGPGETLFPPDFGGTGTTVFVERTCDSADLLKAFAFKERAEHATARKCSNHKSNSDGIIIKFCPAPGVSSWKVGSRLVDQDCKMIKDFTAIAQFHHNVPTLKTGLFLKCESDKLEYLTQNCNDGIHVQNITWPEIETFFTVDW